MEGEHCEGHRPGLERPCLQNILEASKHSEVMVLVTLRFIITLTI